VRLDAHEAVFTALAHPARRRVLLAVYFNGGTMDAGEIAATFSHAWQTTTRHLQVLERAGLLSCEKKGRMRIYRMERIGGKIVKIPPRGPAFLKLTELVKEMSYKVK
jgi:DNA-binding transcriptional ArsR family regulator